VRSTSPARVACRCPRARPPRPSSARPRHPATGWPWRPTLLARSRMGVSRRSRSRALRGVRSCITFYAVWIS